MGTQFVQAPPVTHTVAAPIVQSAPPPTTHVVQAPPVTHTVVPPVMQAPVAKPSSVVMQPATSSVVMQPAAPQVVHTAAPQMMHTAAPQVMHTAAPQYVHTASGPPLMHAATSSFVATSPYVHTGAAVTHHDVDGDGRADYSMIHGGMPYGHVIA